MDEDTLKNITLSIKTVKKFCEIKHKDSPEKDENSNTTNLSALIQNLDKNVETFKIDTSYVRVLNLNNCQLKQVPVIINKLNLTELHLARNELESVPTCLYLGLNQLEVLDLSHNLIGKFDVEPFCRVSLKQLNIECNKLENLPPWILAFRCPRLEKLSFNCNKVQHFKSLLNKTNLSVKVLHIKSCCLRSVDFKFLKNIKTLEELDISNENINNKNLSCHENVFDDLDELFVEVSWQKMQVLKVNNLSISLFPDGIAWLEHLRVLEISYNCLSWLPDDIEYLINLEELDVSNNSLTYFPKKFFNLRCIKVIKAANNMIDILYNICNFKHLQVLDLYSNDLPEFDSELIVSSSLKSLDLEDNYFDTTSLENCTIYKEKCNNYRKACNLGNRFFVHKKNKTYEESEIEDGSSSDYSETDSPLDLEVQIGREEVEENWDDDYCKPKNTKVRHPDITLSDDEWRGEVPGNNIPKIVSPRDIKKVYNHDWIFCDAE